MSSMAQSARPTLSVIVPTYNRERYIRRFLEFHLAAFAGAPFPIEIVVSDNHSTDGTAAVLAEFAANPMLRAVHRGKTSNVYENMLTAYHQARGEFVVYLGDDDYLIPEKIYAYVGDMRENETVVALYAPWFMIDETQNDATIGQFFSLDDVYRFGGDDLFSAMSIILDRHIFPEFAIFRRAMVHAIVDLNQDQAYWAFVWFRRALMHGEVLMMPEPFARITAVSVNNKGHTGNEEVMVAWDRYRGGLEYAIAPVVESGTLSAADYQQLRAKVDGFVAQRMAVAVNFHRGARNWIEAYLLSRRLIFSGYGVLTQEQARELRTLAALQSALREAFRLGAAKVAVDPAIPDGLLAAMPAAESERVTRIPQESVAAAPWRRAIIAHDAGFASEEDGDLVIDLRAVMHRFN